MVHRNKAVFLDFLAGRRGFPVLFEPFLSRRHAETLIWRRGNRLWSEPGSEVSTLISATERTGSDFVWIDLRNRDPAEKNALALAAEKNRPQFPFLGFGFLGETDEDAFLADRYGDAAALWGEIRPHSVPVIRMDGTPEDAVRRGDAGWFAESGAEEALERAGGGIRILGGLGIDRLSLPAPLYARTEALNAAFPGQWAVGSGGMIADDEYLGLIAMLGAYARIRERAEQTDPSFTKS